MNVRWERRCDEDYQALEIEIERAWVLLGLHSRTEHGEVVGVFDSRVSLAHFRDTVFDAWEDLTRG